VSLAKTVGVVLVIVFACGALVASCVAVTNDDGGFEGLRRLELVSHEYECQDHDGCGNSGGEYEGGRSGDQGDGDGQCRNFCNITVPTPVSPQGLIPPTPDGVRQFVLGVMQGGIEMGRLFADTTITFVSNLLVGLARA
jgi:hypothetical protein